MKRRLPIIVWSVCLVAMSHARALAEPAVEAVTFALDPGSVYVPLNEAAQQLHWEVRRDKEEHYTQIHELTPPAGSLRRLSDGTELIRTCDLQLAAAVIDTQLDGRLTIRRGFRRFKLITSPKKVEINLAKQQLRAWQGDRLVLQSRVSTGRNG